MDRCWCYVTLCLLGLGLLQSTAFEVEIKDASGNACIYASMHVNFTIQYETNINSTYKNVTYSAPDKVTTVGSTCGDSSVAPLLMVNFGSGHSWSLSFTKNDTVYSGNLLTFTYNTNDSVLFPDAIRKGPLTATTSLHDPIPLNATYRCLREDVIVAENVTQLFWNVTLQAYAQNSTRSRDVHCSADTPTEAPTTHPVTTPNTTSTTPTTKPVNKPATGNYSVTNGTTVCLLASMGLQLNASLLVEGKNIWTLLNINPNTTFSSGHCTNESALLQLNDNNATVIEFSFFINNKNFYLHEVNVTLTNGSGISQSINQNLSLWEASVGNSFLCHKEQLITVSEYLQINTFEVRVQPFSVKDAKFATAEECFGDSDLSFLIPIVVGAVLMFLIILVFISYLIGRRKSRTGYQSV